MAVRLLLVSLKCVSLWHSIKACPFVSSSRQYGQFLFACILFQRDSWALVGRLECIEIINNTRGDIEGKIWERGDWGQIQVPDVHSFTMSQAKKSF